jgi:hypothetical protein
MKVSIIAAAALLTIIGTFALVRTGSKQSVLAQPLNSAAQNQRESPFACDTSALTPEQRKRHFDELGPALRALRKGVRELPDGYEFQFPSDQKTYAMLTEWAQQESLCCPFFDINVRLDREGGPLWLRLTGREGTKDFIKVDFAKWTQQ